MPSLLNPWVLLGILLCVVGSYVAGYQVGHEQESAACKLRQTQAQQAGQAKADEITGKREQLAQGREIMREQIRVVYRTIKEKADENIQHNTGAYTCGLDADGLQQWNAANAGRAAETMRSEPGYTMSGAATGQVGQIGGFAAKPYRGDGAVQPVPGSDGETGGMRQGGK